MRFIAPAAALRRFATLLLTTTVVATSAWADPVTVFFDGPSNEGMSEASALASGLTILDLDTFAALGVIAVTDQDGADGVVIPPEEAIDPFAITSTWTIESLLSISVIGDPYLLFATAMNRSIFVNGQLEMTSYNAAEVGLTVDANDGWAIVQGDAGGTTVYYVGISLGNLLASVNASTLVNVNYYLLDAFPDNAFPQGLDTLVALPQLDLLVAFNLVPEPGTGLLLGLGLIALGGARRRLN